MLFIKDSEELLDYDIRWARWLGTDTINTSTWRADDGITIAGSEHTSTDAKVWLSGGTEGVSYTVTNTISTAAGRTAVRTIEVKVVAERPA